MAFLCESLYRGLKRKYKKVAKKKRSGERLNRIEKIEHEYTNKMKEKKERLAEFFDRKDYVPMKFKEIASLFQVPKTEREALRRILDDFIKEGVLFEDGEGRYERVGADILTGTYLSTRKGFGFVRISEEEEDIYIPRNYTESAFDGDLVTVKLLKTRGRSGRSREAKILTIVERKTKVVVGTFTRSDNFGFVIPDNDKIENDIYIPKGQCKKIPNGYKVVAEITDYGSFKKSPEGKIVEVIGDIRKKGIDILSVARAYGIDDVFPEEVLEVAKKVPESVSEEEKKGRLDLRETLMVTIDSEDAKDLDDAISVSKETGEDGKCFYRLGVHIADVSHYVKEKSPLDKEAIKRGTSVYLVDRVIPMLPKELSNGICSLNENVDRLALSCLMLVNEKGEVVEHEIAETLIRTNHRMTYTDVNAIITKEEGREDLKERYSDVYEMLLTAEEVAKILRKRRYKRGSIDFDFPETKILLDEDGRISEIKAYDRNEATRLIEDFMLIANETVAEDSFWRELPFLYRTHENPTEEKIRTLNIFIHNFGYSLKLKRGKKAYDEGELHPKEIQKLLQKIAGTKEEMMISRMTLRSLKRAKYTTSSEGHFGLAAKYYCHFTSPIRRYPDLQIHRILKENLRGRLSEKRLKHYQSILDEIALQSSVLERRADEAEREVDKMKAAEYMSGKLGEEFEGVISGVTSWGIYVELPNTIEGMIRMNSLEGDYYSFDAEKMEVVGERTRKKYGLGQQVKVKVISASKELRTIDFILVE